MALQTNISFAVKALLTGTSDLGDPSVTQNLPFSASWGSGTGAGLADVEWGDDRQIAASGTDDLDLAGSLTNALGVTATFAKVRLIAVVAGAGNTNNVVVGAAASAQFVGPFGAATHTVALQPGAGFLITAPSAAGWAVTATTADLLRIANSAGGTVVNYKIMIVGASA